MEAGRDGYAAGQDINQFNLKFVIGDEVIERLIPRLARLLGDRPDGIDLIRQAAVHAPLPPSPDMLELVTWLAGLIIPADELPRPLWATELARQDAADPATREALGAVGEEWAAAVPDGERKLLDFRGKIESGALPTGNPCVLVMLHPDRNGGPGYRLAVILYHNGRDGDPQPGDDVCLSLDEIKSQLERRLPPLISPLKQDALTVEFVVPRQLLNTDFDQWTIPVGPPEESGALPARRYRLGAKHAVVVRDLKRMSPHGDRSMWRKRWQRLCDCTAPIPETVGWVNPRDQYDYESLSTALLRENAHGQVCLALAPLAGASVTDLLDAGLAAGMPAMLWLRQPGETNAQGKKDKQYLARAAESAALSQLPRMIRDMRQEAVAGRFDPAHRGWHLSLLWDNPDRTWELKPLRVPNPSMSGADE
jgi:hypothetical protein